MDENWVYPYGLETSRKKTTYIGGNYHMQYSTTEGMCKGTPPTHVTWRQLHSCIWMGHRYRSYSFDSAAFIVYPLVNQQFATWKIAIEFVGLPIENGDFP